jgi:hypothetical protein
MVGSEGNNILDFEGSQAVPACLLVGVRLLFMINSTF